MTGAVLSSGQHGAEEGSPAMLYVAGAPGTGKSSAVRLSSDDIAQKLSNNDLPCKKDVHFINANCVKWEEKM